jgi:hypothetical protein
MSEGCFYHAGCLEHHDTFDDFLEEWGAVDMDLNRIHRWDWDVDSGQLNLFYVIQRKGYTYSVHVDVEKSDEPRVREFLKAHAEVNRKLWEGL